MIKANFFLPHQDTAHQKKKNGNNQTELGRTIIESNETRISKKNNISKIF